MAASAARKETENIRWELGKALIELKDEWDLMPQREGGWGVKVIILLLFSKVFESSSFPATWNSASQANIQGIWPPGQPSSPTTLPHTPVPQPSCPALHCPNRTFPHALPGNWNVNFWDWLLVQTSCSLRLCSKSALRLCCSPQPIHRSSSVSLSPVSTSRQEPVTFFFHAHSIPQSSLLGRSGFLSAADRSHCALLSARGSTAGANQWYSNMWANSTQGHTWYDFFVVNENGGPGNMKASFGNRLLRFKSQLHYILPVLPWWASCLISLCLSFFIYKTG